MKIINEKFDNGGLFITSQLIAEAAKIVEDGYNAIYEFDQMNNVGKYGVGFADRDPKNIGLSDKLIEVLASSNKMHGRLNKYGQHPDYIWTKEDINEYEKKYGVSLPEYIKDLLMVGMESKGVWLRSSGNAEFPDWKTLEGRIPFNTEEEYIRSYKDDFGHGKSNPYWFLPEKCNCKWSAHSQRERSNLLCLCWDFQGDGKLNIVAVGLGININKNDWGKHYGVTVNSNNTPCVSTKKTGNDKIIANWAYYDSNYYEMLKKSGWKC